MKIKYILLSIVAIILLGFAITCRRSESSPLANFDNATPSDSLLYYFGIIRGAQYWELAETDSTLSSEKARAMYLRGIKDGLDAVKDDDEIYNKGLALGLEMAMNLHKFNSDYDVELDRNLLFASIEYALKHPESIDGDKAARRFERILSRLNIARNERVVKAAREHLGEYAENEDMTRYSDDLYGMERVSGHGDKIAIGNVIYADVDYHRTNGDKLGLPTRERYQVGVEGRPQVVTDIFTNMREGETARFATTARALFGRRCFNFDLNPDDLVIVEVTVHSVDTVTDPDDGLTPES